MRSRHKNFRQQRDAFYYDYITSIAGRPILAGTGNTFLTEVFIKIIYVYTEWYGLNDAGFVSKSKLQTTIGTWRWRMQAA